MGKRSTRRAGPRTSKKTAPRGGVPPVETGVPPGPISMEWWRKIVRMTQSRDKDQARANEIRKKIEQLNAAIEKAAGRTAERYKVEWYDARALHAKLNFDIKEQTADILALIREAEPGTLFEPEAGAPPEPMPKTAVEEAQIGLGDDEGAREGDDA